jgi:hypothetical protein
MGYMVCAEGIFDLLSLPKLRDFEYIEEGPTAWVNSRFISLFPSRHRLSLSFDEYDMIDSELIEVP